MRHNDFIHYIAQKYGLKNNHKERLKFQIGEIGRDIIPDLHDSNTFYECEMTTDKDHYRDVKDRKRVLIVGINSFDAFDEVIIYKIQSPIEIERSLIERRR